MTEPTIQPNGKQQRIILLVGPSGIGKTASCEAAQGLLPQCMFRHLDGLASQWAVRLGWLQGESAGELRRHINDDELFLAFGLEAIGEWAGQHPDQHLVVDVGAGFQDARSAENLRRIHTVIAISAEAEAAYRRFVQFRGARDRRDYMDREFTDRRRKVYANSHFQIDTTHLTFEQTVKRLTEVLRQVVT
jgi:hypothetical protein